MPCSFVSSAERSELGAIKLERKAGILRRMARPQHADLDAALLRAATHIGRSKPAGVPLGHKFPVSNAVVCAGANRPAQMQCIRYIRSLYVPCYAVPNAGQCRWGGVATWGGMDLAVHRGFINDKRPS